MSQTKSSLGFSIIICAHNAEKRLGKTLQHLAFLIIPDFFQVELILVDNNSTDNTQVLASESWKKLGQPFPLNIVEESNIGLSNARRKGVLSARYQYGIFCDDDNLLDERYLIYVREIFEKNPQVGLIGGCSIPVSDIELPPWFYTRCESFAVGIQADFDGDITWRKYVWGAGMSFLVEPFQSLYLNGVEHLTIGRKGTILTSGDDGEISAWFIFLGYKIYYSSKLNFKHLMPADRLTDAYFKRFFYESYSSMWDSYSDYLTIFYFLGVKFSSRKNTFRFFILYFFSLLRIICNSSDVLKVISIERKIKRIKKSTLLEKY